MTDNITVTDSDGIGVLPLPQRSVRPVGQIGAQQQVRQAAAQFLGVASGWRWRSPLRASARGLVQLADHVQLAPKRRLAQAYREDEDLGEVGTESFTSSSTRTRCSVTFPLRAG